MSSPSQEFKPLTDQELDLEVSYWTELFTGCVNSLRTYRARRVATPGATPSVRELATIQESAAVASILTALKGMRP